MEKRKIAIPTNGDKGMKESVSNVFGRAKTFTIIEMEEEAVTGVEIMQNPAMSYKHGAGPIVVKMLIDAGINVVLAGELGPGSSALLKQHNIMMIAVEPGILVSEAIGKISWSTLNITI